MTTVIALKEKDKIYLASDSQVSTGSIMRMTNQKIFKKGEMLIGFSGYSRFGKLLRYGFNIPKQDEKVDDMTYMNTVFIDSLIEYLDKKQYNKKYDSRTDNGNTAIICYKNGIYNLSCDYDVSIYESDFVCIGSGWELAYGSMHTTETINEACVIKEIPEMEAEDRIRLAIGSAIKYDDGTGGEINILNMNLNKG